MPRSFKGQGADGEGPGESAPPQVKMVIPQAGVLLL